MTKLPSPFDFHASRKHTVIIAVCALALLGLRGPIPTVSASTPPSPHAEGIPGYEILSLGRGHGNRLCVVATIDGVKGLMVVDTNAGRTILNDDKYKFLPTEKHNDGLVAAVQDFKIRNAELKSQHVLLAPRHGFYRSGMNYGSDNLVQYDGLLGDDLLTAWSAMIDCGRAALYLSTDPARKQDFGPTMVRDGWTRVPMDEFHQHWTVPCTVSGHSFRVLVDTGDVFSGFDMRQLATAQSYVYDPYRKRNFELSTTENNRVAQITDFRVGGYTPAHMMALAANGVLNRLEHSTGFTDFRTGTPVLGSLGGDFLAANRAIIDVGNHALYLKRAAQAATAAQH